MKEQKAQHAIFCRFYVLMAERPTTEPLTQRSLSVSIVLTYKSVVFKFPNLVGHRNCP